MFLEKSSSSNGGNGSEDEFTVEELEGLVEHFWESFQKDYTKGNETIFRQITYRILHELESLVEDDSSKTKAVIGKLLLLNKEQKYDEKLKMEVFEMLLYEVIQLEKNDETVTITEDSDTKEQN